MAQKKKKKTAAKKKPKQEKAPKGKSLIKKGSVADKLMGSVRTRLAIEQPDTFMGKVRTVASELTRPTPPGVFRDLKDMERRRELERTALRKKHRNFDTLPPDVQRMLEKGHSLAEIEGFEREGRDHEDRALERMGRPPLDTRHEEGSLLGERDRRRDHAQLQPSPGSRAGHREQPWAVQTPRSPRPMRTPPAERARRQDSRDLATSLEDIAFALQKMRQAMMDGDDHELQKLIRDVSADVQRLRQGV